MAICDVLGILKERVPTEIRSWLIRAPLHVLKEFLSVADEVDSVYEKQHIANNGTNNNNTNHNNGNNNNSNTQNQSGNNGNIFNRANNNNRNNRSNWNGINGHNGALVIKRTFDNRYLPGYNQPRQGNHNLNGDYNNGNNQKNTCRCHFRCPQLWNHVKTTHEQPTSSQNLNQTRPQDDIEPIQIVEVIESNEASPPTDKHQTRGGRIWPPNIGRGGEWGRPQ